MTSGLGGVLGGALKGLGGIFGEGSIAQQFLIWGVLQNIAQAGLGPALLDIEQAVNSADPVVTLTPEQLAVGVLRKILDEGNSESEAAKSGIGPGRFQQLVKLAESPPSLGLVLAAYQRTKGLVGDGASVPIDLPAILADLGIAEKYWPLIESQSILIPDAAQVLDAWLKGQIEPDEGHSRLLAAGMDPSWIQTAYNANGQAPTPMEALEMLNRGLIPSDGEGPESISYHQAFLEGPWRNKWEEPFRGLGTYVTPPRSVVAQLRSGAIDDARAAELFAKSGVDAQTAAEFIKEASHVSTAAQKNLTQAEILAGYADGLLTAAQAVDDLVAARFSRPDAEYLVALTDKKAALASVKSATTRLQTLYLNGTNSVTATTNALHQLGLSDQQASSLISTWNLERTSAVKALTEGQVISAWNYGYYGNPADPGVIATVVARLQAIGYSQDDALALMSARWHGPIGMNGPITS